MPFISVEHVSKHFKVPKREAGIRGVLRSLIRPRYETIKAVEDVAFTLDPSELVGYIGPNGAGKSTTIKMLSGILVPDAGRVVVNGVVPYEERQKNARQIGVVFGQRSSLEWDLPMLDTLQLYQKMYKIEDATFRRNVDLFIDLLDMKEFVDRPVRNMSLGQKIRANIAVSLLHDPPILYLDEPTIGLDVVAKAQIRKFIRALNREKGTTLILTTHDMDDIEAMCDRIIMIDKGRKIFDGSMDAFRAQHGDEYVVRVTVQDDTPPAGHPLLTLEGQEGTVYRYKGYRHALPVPEALSHFLAGEAACPVRDIQVAEPNIEDIVRGMYQRA